MKLKILLYLLYLLISKVAYAEDEKIVLYIIATSEQQRNDWISAIRNGWWKIVSIQY